VHFSIKGPVNVALMLKDKRNAYRVAAFPTSKRWVLPAKAEDLVSRINIAKKAINSGVTQPYLFSNNPKENNGNCPLIHA
jgi:hypothetical protein